MRVLTHVVLKGSLPSEPVATQSLAYILNAKKDIARAFIGIFREVGIEFEPASIKAEREHEDSRPDLTIHDSHGRVRAFVENKFWAGLTEAQPVSYLGELPEDFPTALLFVVPQKRVTTVWNELKLRCRSAKLEWENGLRTHNVTSSRVGHKILLITSWSYVLERLLNTAQSEGHKSICHDILQLQDLTNQMDSEAFLPIRADELTDQETARRLVNYCDLIDDIMQNLTDSELPVTWGRGTAHGWYTNGRYLRVYERFGLWFGIDFKVWSKSGVTPLWWRFEVDSESSGVAGRFQMIQDLFDDVQYYEDWGYLYIPIRLKAGVERDTVVKDAAAQMTRIAKILLKQFPDN